MMVSLQQYCVNQGTAIKMLSSLREANPELAAHLQVRFSYWFFKRGSVSFNFGVEGKGLGTGSKKPRFVKLSACPK
jgi:hypothetical protein